MLLHAGVMAGDALSLLAEESQGERSELLRSMVQWVDNGGTLSAAMVEMGCFPAYACGLVEVGERSGRLEEALNALARYYENRDRMERHIRSALLYPCVLLALMLVVIGVLLVRVLPVFNDVYASLGGQLTGVAAGLLGLGRALDAAMPAVWAVLLAVAALAVAFAAAPKFRGWVLDRWHRGRGDKGLSRKLTTARLAQALAMGMASGMDLEEALDMAGKVVGEDAPAAQVRCQRCRELLEQGKRSGEALGESGLLPSAQCRLLEVAQRSGAGDTAMARIADTLEEEGEAALEARVSKIEPALVLVCAVLVGLILLSVMLPLTHIMSAIG